MKYRVKSEYLDSWVCVGGDPADDLIVDDDEIRRLAYEWADGDVQEKVNELYDQVVELEGE